MDTQSNSDALLGQSIMAQQVLAVSIAQSVAGAMQRRSAVVEALAADPLLLQQPPQSQQRWIARVVLATQQPSILATYTEDGTPLARSDGLPLIRASADLPLAMVAQQQGATMVVRQAPGATSLVVFAAPVRRVDSTLTGFVTAEADLSALVGLLAPASLGRGDLTYLVSGDGRIVAEPVAAMVAAHADISRVPSLMAALRGEQPGSLTYHAPAGDILAGYAHVPGTQWAVVVERPFFNAYATLETIKNRAFWLLIGIMATASGVGFVVAGRLSAPLRMLSRAVDDLANGNDSAPLPVTQLSEVTRLANAFVAMRQRLAERTAERTRAESEVRAMNETLGQRVEDRTSQLAVQFAEADHARREARAVLDATSDAMVWMSDDRRILAINSSFGEMFQVRRQDDLIGQPSSRLAELTRHWFGETEATIAMFSAWVANPDSHFVRDLEQVAPVARTLAASIVPAPGVGRLYIFRDVTRERAVDRMKSEFVALVSHELRTPLTSIKGYVELVLGGEVGPVTPDQREFLGIAASNADRLGALIAQILDISRIESGAVAGVRRPVDLVEIVQTVARSLRPQIERKRQELTLTLDTTRLLVLADQDQLIQVVTNLLQNASKYTAPGGRLTCGTGGAGDQVRLAIGDTGIGMSSDEQTHVFERFYRASERPTQEVGATGESGGTGLGLAITKALVELHGGTITVASMPGEGSTFTVTLPRMTDEAAEEPPAPAPLNATSTPPVAVHRMVLVVEADLQIAQLLQRFLKRGGYQVVVAHSGAEGLRLAQCQSPDLITLDIGLPDTDGFAVLDQLQRSVATAAIPVLIISSMPDDGRGDRLGAAGYYTKPVVEDLLLQQVGKILV